jgi:8-oxo-dGTP diphosphatase
LEQLYTFGTPQRDPRERVISVAYYALVPVDSLKIRAGTDAIKAELFSYNKLPALAFDHANIIEHAHQRLSAKMDYSTIALYLMPKAFTLSELQHVYEIIKDTALDKRNFRKRMLSYDCIQDTGEQRRNSNHRPARLYTYQSNGTIEFTK